MLYYYFNYNSKTCDIGFAACRFSSLVLKKKLLSTLMQVLGPWRFASKYPPPICTHLSNKGYLSNKDKAILLLSVRAQIYGEKMICKREKYYIL